MNQTAVNFAKALYSLAEEEKLQEQFLHELTVMQEAFAQEPDFLTLLGVPNLSKQEKCIILDNCFRDKVHIYVLNFTKLLTTKGGIRHFDDCCKAYRDIYNEANGIVPKTLKKGIREVISASGATPVSPSCPAESPAGNTRIVPPGKDSSRWSR